jgi:hypothetical protein
MLWQRLDNQVSTGIDQYLHTSKVLLQTLKNPASNIKIWRVTPPRLRFIHLNSSAAELPSGSLHLPAGFFKTFPTFAGIPPGFRCLFWLAQANGNALRIADFALSNPGVASGKHEKRTQ